MSDSDEEAFHDASEDMASPDAMALSKSLDEAMQALELFMNNKFSEARALVSPWAHSSMYHALWHGLFHFIEAFLTFEPQHIEAAAQALDQSVQVCDKQRKKSSMYESLGKKMMMRKTNYDTWTEEEIHAELCYAECLLLRAIITFVEDENLMGFVKGGMKIRSCINAYKECWNILKTKNWTDRDKHKGHFESGVRIGVGTYNFVLSMLPPNIMRLLEFVGFSGNREYGLKQLKLGADIQGSLRQVLCAAVLLNFNLFTMYVMGQGKGDLELAEQLIQDQLAPFPSGVWYNFFRARLECLKGELGSAATWYTKAWNSQNEWEQFHHICYWELMWVHCFQQDWCTARDFAERLCQESRWSQALSAYQKASFMCMFRDKLTNKEEEELIHLYKDIPGRKRRFAGKSLPMEKFAVKKCEQFLAQGNTLVLPALELMYLWNGFKVVGKKPELVRPFLALVEKTLKHYEKDKGNKGDTYFADNKSLLLLLCGVCQACLGHPNEAEQCFKQVIGAEKHIVGNQYLVPYATYELGVLYWSKNDLSKATVTLEAAKNNYKGFTLESRLHFRIHSALTEIQSSLKRRSSVQSTSSSSL